MVRILDIENYAKENNVPIMMKDGIEYLKQYIKDNNVTSILEIGTAIGYSAIQMALVNDNINIVTIERDENRYNEALKNISEFNLQNRIEAIFEDALESKINGKYDLIFIDAAKSQSIKFFEKFSSNLSDNGVIITDNLNFHGLTHTKERIQNRNTRQLVRKINEYIEFLKNNKQYNTTFIDIGDGISISKKI